MSGQRRFSAVLWDFGGVILSSPFDAFVRYETQRGLPPNFLRQVNTANAHGNAWAKIERGEIGPDEFDVLFAQESAARGHEVRGSEILPLLAGDLRPRMVAAVKQVKAAGYRVACLTNNMNVGHGAGMSADPFKARAVQDVLAEFELVVESRKAGARKPEPRFYEAACRLLSLDPKEAVFLDDLGINLKPAAAMGMATIKVGDPDAALAELGMLLGLKL